MLNIPVYMFFIMFSKPAPEFPSILVAAESKSAVAANLLNQPSFFNQGTYYALASAFFSNANAGTIPLYAISYNTTPFIMINVSRAIKLPSDPPISS